MSGSYLCIPRNDTAWPSCFQNRIIMFCLPISTFMYLRAIYIAYGFRNWEQDRAVSFLGKQKSDFRYSVVHDTQPAKQFTQNTTISHITVECKSPMKGGVQCAKHTQQSLWPGHNSIWHHCGMWKVIERRNSMNSLQLAIALVRTVPNP